MGQEGLGPPRGGSVCRGIPALGLCGLLRPSSLDLHRQKRSFLFSTVFRISGEEILDKCWVISGNKKWRAKIRQLSFSACNLLHILWRKKNYEMGGCINWKLLISPQAEIFGTVLTSRPSSKTDWMQNKKGKIFTTLLFPFIHYEQFCTVRLTMLTP